MGMETGGGGGIYYKASMGAFKKDGKDCGNKYTGFIKDITIKEDEYQKKKFDRVTVTMEDAASTKEKPDIAKITFRAEGWYANGFFSRLPKVDLSKEITLGILSSDKNDKISWCYIKQGGQVVKKQDDFIRDEAGDWSKAIVEYKLILEPIPFGRPETPEQLPPPSEPPTQPEFVPEQLEAIPPDQPQESLDQQTPPEEDLPF